LNQSFLKRETCFLAQGIHISEVFGKIQRSACAVALIFRITHVRCHETEHSPQSISISLPFPTIHCLSSGVEIPFVSHVFVTYCMIGGGDGLLSK